MLNACAAQHQKHSEVFSFSSCQFKTTVRRWQRCIHLLLAISNFISEYLFLVRRQTSELVRSKACIARSNFFLIKRDTKKIFYKFQTIDLHTQHHTSSWWSFSFSFSNLLNSIQNNANDVRITRSFRAC